MKRRTVWRVIAAVAIVNGLSCNIFNPANRRHPEDYGPKALVLEGKLRMRDEEWQEAIDLFSRALAQDSSLSEAYFYTGKCILRQYRVDLAEVWEHINPAKPDSSAVPFLFKIPPGRSLSEDIVDFSFPYLPSFGTARTLLDSVFLERKRIYDAVCKAIVYLEKINSNPGMMDGVISRKQYESDYLVEISVQAVLSMVDLNHNKQLDFVTDSMTEEENTFRVLVQDIPSLDPDSMKLDSLKEISNNPQTINARIDSMRQLLDSANLSYLKFAAELEEGAERSDKINKDQAKPLGDMIDKFRRVLPFYYYQDKADNDSDYYNTNGNATIEPMIWIDWDGDERIDIDSAGDTYIGDSMHIKQHPNLYEFIDEPGGDYRRFRYKGLYTYEFIAGDWGVDEEKMDGADNDRDGLTDEDCRTVADSLDDDKRDTKKLMPLLWTDLDGDFMIDSLTEVTGGTWDVDEEWFDGLDNDGDGDVDEDVGEGNLGPPEEKRAELIELLRQKGLRGEPGSPSY